MRTRTMYKEDEEEKSLWYYLKAILSNLAGKATVGAEYGFIIWLALNHLLPVFGRELPIDWRQAWIAGLVVHYVCLIIKTLLVAARK